MITFHAAQEKLSSIDSLHLLLHWSALNHNEQRHLLAQIGALDIEQLAHQRALLTSPPPPPLPIDPLPTPPSPSTEDLAQGTILLAKGAVAAIILAGGQGTRLGWPGPKGTYPLLGKSLFQRLAERCLAASDRCGHPLPLAIMTSPQNHDETSRFFESHNLFGLQPSQLTLFTQSELPLLTQAGDLFLSSPHTLALGPDGNGSLLTALHTSGLLPRFLSQAIHVLTITLIDNPLADPYDPHLIGHLAARHSDLALKSITRRDPEEKVGLLTLRNHRLQICPYANLPPNHQNLPQAYADIAIYALTTACAQALLPLVPTLPLHPALKAATLCSTSSELQTILAYKFERFFFDLLPHIPRISPLLYPRDSIFAPIKNASGPDSPETAAHLLALAGG